MSVSFNETCMEANRAILNLTSVIESIRCCHDSSGTLEDLNKTARAHLQTARSCVKSCHQLCEEMDNGEERDQSVATLKDLDAQLSLSQVRLREANFVSQSAIGRYEKEQLLVRRRGGGSKEEADEYVGGKQQRAAEKAGDVTDGLRGVARLLASNVARSQHTADLLATQSATIGDTADELHAQGGHIHAGRALLSKFQRRQLTDKVLVLMALLFFFSCVLYVLQQRLMPKFSIFS